MTKSLCWKTPLATACPQALFTVIESSPSAEVWSSGRFEKQHHVVESTLTLEPDRRSLCSPMYSQSSFVHVENRDNNSNLKIYWNYLKGRITSSLQNEMFSIKEKSLLFFFLIIFHCTSEGKCTSVLSVMVLGLFLRQLEQTDELGT